MPKKIEPLSKQDAAVLLTSAVFYCQQAGVPISVSAKDGTLWLGFSGLEMIRPTAEGGGFRFIPTTDIGSPATGRRTAPNGGD